MHPLHIRTVEDWALSLIQTRALGEKLSPPPPPAAWEASPSARRITAPGRPSELVVLERARKAPRPGSLTAPEPRARLFALLHHHEVQAAELFAWALLAFPESPASFRKGLLRLALEELSHARLYRGQLTLNGFDLADFPVRDWFWEHIPLCKSPTQFVALMGLGFEGGNLEHAERYAQGLEAAGDRAGAGICRRVAADEEAHVRFAAGWFRRFEGELTVDAWSLALPGPLTPAVLKGARVARGPRLRAGLGEEFVDGLEAWPCGRPGS